MNGHLSYVRAPAAAPGTKAPLRCCPRCGGLECLCRPRFFAGQLLTEEELNGLDRYIVAKNRLHNRYLHGWGVVCGLEVVCDDCGDGVIVNPGYALSPCGDDVIVCRETPVDVCRLIDACRKVDVRDCEPPSRGDDGCDDAVQDWVLAICYQETPSRGVMPLRGGPACGCGPNTAACGCGGGCGCHKGSGGGGGHNGNGHAHGGKTGACGCGGATSTATATTTRCAPPLQCEPTVLCEGYTFRVYKAPRRTDDRRPQLGALVDRFSACVKGFVDAMPDLPPANASPQAQHDWCCAVKEALLDYFETHPPSDCRLPAAVARVYCPVPNDPNFPGQMQTAANQFLLVALQILIGCFCSALIPPCPDPVHDDCIPLAVVTVQMRGGGEHQAGCRVQRICNWTVLRKYATTFLNLQYWLSFIPIGRLLREALESFCCRQFAIRGPARQPIDQPPPGGPSTPFAAAAGSGTGGEGNATTPGPPPAGGQPASPSAFFTGSAQTMARSRAFLQLAVEALVSRDRSRDADELVLGVLGEERPDGQPYLSELESEHLLQFIMLDQMAKPLLRAFTPQVTERVTPIVEAFRGAAAESPADLERRVAELAETVAQLRAALDDLQRGRGPQ